MKPEQEPDLIDILLPKLGESIVGATIVQWLKKEGENVLLDEPLLEVSTDKVNSEIPSPVAGILREICVRVDDEIEVGGLLAKIEKSGLLSEAPMKKTMASFTSACSSAVSGKEEISCSLALSTA